MTDEAKAIYDVGEAIIVALIVKGGTAGAPTREVQAKVWAKTLVAGIRDRLW